MNVGRAITEGMRADRRRDLHKACGGGWGGRVAWVMRAWCWWGWDIHGSGGLGFPGAELGEPQWQRYYAMRRVGRRRALNTNGPR